VLWVLACWVLRCSWRLGRVLHGAPHAAHACRPAPETLVLAVAGVAVAALLAGMVFVAARGWWRARGARRAAGAGGSGLDGGEWGSAPSRAWGLGHGLGSGGQRFRPLDEEHEAELMPRLSGASALTGGGGGSPVRGLITTSAAPVGGTLLRSMTLPGAPGASGRPSTLRGSDAAC
jgi:hypothetical protein